jgi:hypothetical protein
MILSLSRRIQGNPITSIQFHHPAISESPPLTSQTSFRDNFQNLFPWDLLRGTLEKSALSALSRSRLRSISF